MAEGRATVAGLTLPPKVAGAVSGHLVMKVDEVLWARKPPGEVSAVAMWWGGEEPTTFRPTDVAEEAVRRKNAGVIYEIRTSLALFDKYLRKCGSLDIAMADKYGMPIGCVSVPNLWQMINTCPYQGYYPIVNNFGNRIGDLHVSFNLRMSAGTDTASIKPAANKTNAKTKEPKQDNPVQKSHFSKEAKTKKNEKVVIDNLSKPEVSCLVAQRGEASDSAKRASPTSNIISEILEHGTRLRDAMTASVLEDGVQLDLKNIPNFNVLSSDILKHMGLPQTLDPFALCNPHVGPKSQNSCTKKISTVSQKKVLDYLSGKPMSSLEEEEALSALRNITPTKDIIEKVVPSSCREFENEESSEANMPKDLAKTVTEIIDVEKNSSANINDCSFEVDSQIISQINCLRITVHSLVLNSVGSKRIRSAPRKKGSFSVSNTSLHPPGVTYFVEYKFPLVTESRSWESDVRYCSKRFNGHEISFGDRTVHNIPETWRSSISEETNLCSLISALSFKICARHLHQRVPVCLGTAAPDSAKELLNSLHLRHDFDLPVIASDCLPVAQLKICLEFGRDRIHFGGLLDPENNSLGIRSPRKTSSSPKKSQLSLKSATAKKTGRSVTTVTRNIHSKHSSVFKWKTGVPRQASQADQVIKQLVADAKNAKPSSVSDSSSAPSSARPKIKPQNSSLLVKNQSLPLGPGRKSSLAKPVDASTNVQLLKHELAVTVLQIIDSNYLKCSPAEDRGFYVSYKLPVTNAIKKELVVWDTVCTEPSEGAEGTWPKSQNKIHTAVLPKQKAFHVFLEQAFKLQGMQKRACVVFSLFIRTYGEKVRDLKVAEAFLPLTCMLTLEEAYNDASKNNASFSPSSCSSVVLDLPLEDLSLKPKENGGSLRVKLDYRYSDMETMKTHLPRSRGDSVTENLPCYDFSEIQYQKQKPEIEVVLRESFDSSGTVPSWAADKRPPSQQNEDTFLIGNTISLDSDSAGDFNGHDKNYRAKNLHASWEPAEGLGNRSRLPSRMSDSAYQLSSSRNPEGHRSIAEVIDLTNEMSECALDRKSPSINMSSRLRSGEDSHGKVKRVVDAITSPMQHKQTSNRGTSPIATVSSKATSTEKIQARDKTQQVIVESVSQGSQTTPRTGRETSQRDGSTSASHNRVLPENESEIQMPSRKETTTAVLTQRSVDDVETVEIVSEQEFGSGTSVHGESSEGPSQEILQGKEVVHNSTDGTSNSFTPTFQAKVGVECALHLQTTSKPSRLGQSSNSVVFVSIDPCGVDGRVSAHLGLNPVSISPAVENNGEPEWHWQTEVQLPVDLLVSSVKRLIFKLWLKDGAIHHERFHDHSSASLIGFSALDLTVLSAGLPFISGWYNVMDFSGACRGQIKLSVEPLQSVSTLIDSSSLIYSNGSQSNSPLSMFVAHCAYPEFPSHVTQFADMRVQQVDPQPSDQAMSTVISGYKLVREHCQKRSSGTESNSHATLQRKRDTLTDEASLPDVGQLNITPTETVSAPSALQACAEAGSESALEVAKDPSVLLREKLSELDTITKSIKARVLNRVESAKVSGSSVAPFSVNLDEAAQTHSEAAQNHHVGGGDEPAELGGHQCQTCACHMPSNVSMTEGEPSRQTRDKRHSKAFGDHHSEARVPASQTKGKRAVPKQRRMWERNEDLIDFGSLCVEDEDEDEDQQGPHAEDVSEWLTEAALQQVFNPFLFNDILNSMNSSRGGVQVIELDSDSDEGTEASGEATDGAQPAGSGQRSKNCQNWSSRGDGTYRKETAQIPSNQSGPNHHIRSSVAACDADSGVDVDLSANFHPGSYRTAGTRPEYFPSHLRNSLGVRTASSEREESSSCSFSSRHQQSTVPSSASATPSDSPQHLHSRQCSASTSNPRRRN